MKKYKVLFCDLDGTLIKTKSGNTFPKGIWDMELRIDVLDAIKFFAPDYVFIISNQGGIEKGFVRQESIARKMSYVCQCIKDYCIIIHNVEYCYCPSNSLLDGFRKPNTGMLEYFYHDYYGGNDFNKKDVLMIGDASGKEGQFSDTDKKTAENFGIDYMDVADFFNCYREEVQNQ